MQRDPVHRRCPKAEALSRNRHFSSLHENPVKGWREGADPRGHRHRPIGCATTCPLANALGSARIGQPSALSDNRWSRWQVSQSSRNRPGPKRFEDRDCVREGRASLSTRSLVAFLCVKPLACPPGTAQTLIQYTAHASCRSGTIDCTQNKSTGQTKARTKPRALHSARNGSMRTSHVQPPARPDCPTDVSETPHHMQGT